MEQPPLTMSATCPSDTPPFDYGPMGLTSAPNMALGIKAFLVTASSRPPFKGPNDWTIAITNLDGAAMPDANLTWACAFMPTHGHGSNPKMVNKLGDGQFELVKQNMAMEGGWEIRLWVDPMGGGTPYTGGSSALDPNACRGPGTDVSLVLKACVPG